MAGEGPNMQSLPSQGAVPSQQSGATVNPAEVLENVAKQATQDLSKYALAAATPISGGNQGQMPAKFMQPQQTPGRGNLDHREVIGAGNARAQGIGNTVIATLNTISEVKGAMDNKKKVEIASSTQQLLQAQAAANQAKQLLEQDPNNAKAKEQLEHNNDIMGTILTGKHGKDIQAGFNIDYTDPSKNKTIQHDAVAMGKARAEAKQKSIEDFNKATPEVQVPNTQAQAVYAAKQEEAKNTLASIKAMIPLITASMKSGDVDRRIEGTITVQEMKDISAKSTALINAQAAMSRLSQKFQDAKVMEGIKHGDRISEIDRRATDDLQNYHAKLTAKDSSPLARQKANDQFQARANSTLSAMQTSLANLTYERSSLASATKPGSKEELKRIDDAIYMQTEQIKAYKDNVQVSTDYYNDLLRREAGKGSNADAGRSSTKSGLASASSYLEPSDSLDDDEDETDQP